MWWLLLVQESDDLCRGLWIHQEIWGGQLWGETDHSDQWRTPGIKSQQFLFPLLAVCSCKIYRLFWDSYQMKASTLINVYYFSFSVMLQSHLFLFVLVCKDLPEPNGSHLQRANSPVHPDFDWWHSAGRDKSTVCRKIILMFTFKWKYSNHSLTITIIQANGKRKTTHLAIVIRLLFRLLLAC